MEILAIGIIFLFSVLSHLLLLALEFDLYKQREIQRKRIEKTEKELEAYIKVLNRQLLELTYRKS